MIPKRGLTRFTENGAVFEDGSEINDIDLVVLATGFIYEFDILDVPGFKGIDIIITIKALRSIFAHISFSLQAV